MSEHDFITVKDRRWCVCCDLFQQRKPGYHFREPTARCPRTTNYARRMDSQRALNHLNHLNNQQPAAEIADVLKATGNG